MKPAGRVPAGWEAAKGMLRTRRFKQLLAMVALVAMLFSLLAAAARPGW